MAKAKLLPLCLDSRAATTLDIPSEENSIAIPLPAIRANHATLAWIL